MTNHDTSIVTPMVLLTLAFQHGQLLDETESLHKHRAQFPADGARPTAVTMPPLIVHALRTRGCRLVMIPWLILHDPSHLGSDAARHPPRPIDATSDLVTPGVLARRSN